MIRYRRCTCGWNGLRRRRRTEHGTFQKDSVGPFLPRLRIETVYFGRSPSTSVQSEKPRLTDKSNRSYEIIHIDKAKDLINK